MLAYTEAPCLMFIVRRAAFIKVHYADKCRALLHTHVLVLMRMVQICLIFIYIEIEIFYGAYK